LNVPLDHALVDPEDLLRFVGANVTTHNDSVMQRGDFDPSRGITTLSIL
jgi:hypothetical protein